ncbi:hypothetical protein SKAU_G00065890 [Synaphobranchus kaupii]|uniref:Uncharacterized protein n=1 Tax=Synaphobranchus kaupii TaxID=118154 RepID=A0A9Q1G5S3_SYNKA|nr:hypothetical protein SKAU_G00065890 [Synaphobranchus kaupii]
MLVSVGLGGITGSHYTLDTTPPPPHITPALTAGPGPTPTPLTGQGTATCPLIFTRSHGPQRYHIPVEQEKAFEGRHFPSAGTVWEGPAATPETSAGGLRPRDITRRATVGQARPVERGEGEGNGGPQKHGG